MQPIDKPKIVATTPTIIGKLEEACAKVAIIGVEVEVIVLVTVVEVVVGIVVESFAVDITSVVAVLDSVSTEVVKVAGSALTTIVLGGFGGGGGVSARRSSHEFITRNSSSLTKFALLPSVVNQEVKYTVCC